MLELLLALRDLLQTRRTLIKVYDSGPCQKAKDFELKFAIDELDKVIAAL